MQLTRSQIRYLRYFRDHRTDSPAIKDFLWRFGRVLVLWTMVMGGLAWFCVSVGRQEFAFLFIGLLIGSVLREVRQLQWTMSIWPAAVAITDWRRVEELLSASPDSGEPSAAAARPRE